MTEIDERDKALKEDAAYTTYVIAKIQRGLADIGAGRVVDEAEVERRMAQLMECADDATQARIDELADRCTEGTLTPAERSEYEAYVVAIEMITLRQAKARRAGRE